MFRWFVPAFTVFLLLRHGAFRLSLFWAFLVANGLLNAGLAFLHLHWGWVEMYARFDLGDKVFGSFGYPNHGAMYFLLLLGLSSGWCLREIRTDASQRHWGLLLLHGMGALVFALAACLSTSRAGLLGVGLFFIAMVVYLAVTSWHRSHPVQKLYGLIGLTCFAFACIGLFLLFAQEKHLREVELATGELKIDKEFNARFFQTESAWRIWKDHPWVGVGPWGYKWLAADYLAKEYWGQLRVGKANVHNDYAQFLAEFGLAGFLCFGLVFGGSLARSLSSMLRSASDERSLWADPARTGALFAVGIVCLDACIDLPFRSPAVLMHASVLLAFASLPIRDASVWPPAIDWNLLQPPGVRIVHKDTKRGKNRSKASDPNS